MSDLHQFHWGANDSDRESCLCLIYISFTGCSNDSGRESCLSVLFTPVSLGVVMTVTGSLVSLCLIYTSFTGSDNDSDRESCLSV